VHHVKSGFNAKRAIHDESIMGRDDTQARNDLAQTRHAAGYQTASKAIGLGNATAG
jgi:hypothetical protein